MSACIAFAAALALGAGAAPPDPPPAGSGPVPAATAAPPVPATLPLDPSTFARSADSLSDVKAVTRPFHRAGARIDGVTLDLGPLPAELEVRRSDGLIELVSRGGSGPPAVLGSFRWRGPVLEWSWFRASIRAHARALERLDALLPGATIDVALDGGVRERLCAPPAAVRLALGVGSAVRARVAGPGGRAVRLLVDEDRSGSWQADAAPPVDSAVLASPAGEVRLRWDAASGEVEGEWTSAQALELRALRAELAERRKESRQRSAEEQRIIAMEIAGLERRIDALAKARSADMSSVGPFPAAQLVGEDGRVFAGITVVFDRKESR